MWTRWLVIAGVAGGFTLTAVPAAPAAQPDDAQPVEAPRPAALDRPTPEHIAAWIQALSSDTYSDRKAATQKLLAAGREAIAQIAQAADADDLEIPGRCIRILTRLADSNDAATKQAAVTALQGLARSERSYVTRAAERALLEPPAISELNLRLRRGRPVFRGVRVQRAPMQRVLVRELTVEEEGRKVSIHYQTGARREIRVRIKETIEGQEQTSEFRATSTNELREKSPLAADLYAKYARELLRQQVQVVVDNQAPLQPARAGLPAVRIQVQANNWERSIQVEENGNQIRITETAGRDISVQVTETTNGKSQTVEYKARDPEELKRQHPEAAELYEKYAARRHGIQVTTGPGGVQIQAVPLQPAAPKTDPGGDTSGPKPDDAGREPG